MKTFSWFGAFVLLAALAAGTASVLQQHPQSRATPAADRTLASLPGSDVAGIPSSTSSAKPAGHPREKASAPAPRPVVVTAIAVGSTQQALINQDRARYGLKPLTWSSCLASIAYSNALRMAGQGYISHADGPARDLGCHLGYHAGENVGCWSGGGFTQTQLDVKLNLMFMSSPDHRANILSPYYHFIGTAWKTAPNGAHYIAVEFS